jgi:glucuronokinase
MADAATAVVPARAALAGNPSDGYGGAVVAVTIAGPAATAQARWADRDGVTPAGCAPLVDAARRRFRRGAGGRADAPVVIEVQSTIPREVGLAGSSAIVLATLRALGALTGSPIPERDLAAVALAVEVDDLGIAAGPQDRVVQARGGVVAMDFADSRMGAATALPAAGLPSLLLGWLPAAGAPSGAYHSDLRARFDRGEPAVVDAMARLRAHGLAAAAAIRAGDHAALAAAMDGSYDARAELGPLDPRHAALVAAARAAGLSANYAGSGGAIVATGGALDALRAALTPLGAEAMALTVRERDGPHLAAGPVSG